MSDSTDRLDSWKAIAEYLNRDIRTLRRWQRQGLPVRRVPGARGNSVFAFQSEIDEWLRAAGPEQRLVAMPTAESLRTLVLAPARKLEPASITPVTARTRARPFPRRWSAAVAVFAVIFFGWRTFAPNAAPQKIDVRLTGNAGVATGPAGNEVWRKSDFF